VSSEVDQAIERELAEHAKAIDFWLEIERRAAAARDYMGAHEARAAGDRWGRSLERLKTLFGRGSADTSRGRGHAADSGAARANVAHETATQSESLAGGAS
jgi:hypothetical protein